MVAGGDISIVADFHIAFRENACGIFSTHPAACGTISELSCRIDGKTGTEKAGPEKEERERERERLEREIRTWLHENVVDNRVRGHSLQLASHVPQQAVGVREGAQDVRKAAASSRQRVGRVGQRVRSTIGAEGGRDVVDPHAAVA